MIRITMYEVVNGEKGKPFIIDKLFKDNKEVEQFRLKLEAKHHCWKKTLTGTKKIKQILFYKTEQPKETKRFLNNPPKKGKRVKVYMDDKNVKYGIVIGNKVIELPYFFREIAVLKECSSFPISKCDYFLDKKKVIFE